MQDQDRGTYFKVKICRAKQKGRMKQTFVPAKNVFNRFNGYDLTHDLGTSSFSNYYSGMRNLLKL
jgi:hypothetical protein